MILTSKCRRDSIVESSILAKYFFWRGSKWLGIFSFDLVLLGLLSKPFLRCPIEYILGTWVTFYYLPGGISSLASVIFSLLLPCLWWWDRLISRAKFVDLWLTLTPLCLSVIMELISFSALAVFFNWNSLIGPLAVCLNLLVVARKSSFNLEWWSRVLLLETLAEMNWSSLYGCFMIALSFIFRLSGTIVSEGSLSCKVLLWLTLPLTSSNLCLREWRLSLSFW